MTYHIEQSTPVPQRASVTSWQRGSIVSRVLRELGLLLTLLFIMLPIVWMAITAFKPQSEIFTLNVLFQPTLDSFRTIFQPPLSFGPLLRNTIIVATGTILISTPLALMAAYAFARYSFALNAALLTWVLTTQFIPQVVVAIPFFNLFRVVGLVDTLWGLIILNLSVALPYAIWMIKGFVDGVPIELEEAALVDGCSEGQMIWRIALPLIMPGVIVAAVFSFITAWNEFLFAFIMTRTETARTLQVGLINTVTVDGVRWDWMSATGLIVMVPIFVLSLLVRNHFVQGMTMGAVK
jgi:multiple sugar transport system permease protein